MKGERESLQILHYQSGIYDTPFSHSLVPACCECSWFGMASIIAPIISVHILLDPSLLTISSHRRNRLITRVYSKYTF